MVKGDKIEYMNKTFEKLSGYNLEDIQNKSIEVICNSQDEYKKIVNTIAENITSKERFSFLSEFKHKEGHIFQAEVTAVVMDKDAPDRGIVCTFIDTQSMASLCEKLRPNIGCRLRDINKENKNT